MALEIFTTKSMPTRHDPDRNCVTRTTTIRPFGIYTIGNPPANCTIQGTISESGYRRLHPIGGDYAWGLRARAASGCGGGLLLVVVAFGAGSAVVSFAFGLVPGWGRLSPNPFFLFCLTYPIGGILGRNTKRPKRNNTTRNHRRGQQS